MSKNKFQDIIKIKNVKKFEGDSKRMLYPDAQNEISPPVNLFEVKQKKKVSYNMLWFIALISMVVLFFAVSSLFSDATVIITPKTKDFVLNKSISATKDADTGTSYHLFGPISGEESKEVAGGPEQDYLEYAGGTILLYNAFSASSQPLSQDTRLEGSNGKIYKTKTKIIIPGMAKNGTPGQIEVDIYGAEVGEEYNSDPLDFKILGFKGTSKYSKIYAESVGGITGGLKGKSRQVSDADKTEAIKELTDTLTSKLFEQAKNQTPQEFVLLKDATFFNEDSESVTPAPTTGDFIIDLKGTFSALLFNKEQLASEIIQAYSDQNAGADVSNTYVSNVGDLSFSDPNIGIADLDTLTDITFTLSGTPKIVWQVDTEKLIADLLGKSKKDFNQILSAYSNIDSANLSLKPIWDSSLPDKEKDIKIIVNYPN